MKRMMIDVDGVLADFIKGFTMLAWTMFGTPVQSVFEKQRWHGFDGLDGKQVDEVWRRINESPTFWESLPLCVTPEEMQELDDLTAEADVYFVTNRGSSKLAKRQTENWLIANGIEEPTVIVSGKKGEVCRALDINYSLEDKAANADCITWLTDNRTKSFILTRPYNSGVHAPHSSKVQRVPSVREFLAQVQYERAMQCGFDQVFSLLNKYQNG